MEMLQETKRAADEESFILFIATVLCYMPHSLLAMVVALYADAE